VSAGPTVAEGEGTTKTLGRTSTTAGPGRLSDVAEAGDGGRHSPAVEAVAAVTAAAEVATVAVRHAAAAK
jgi:hypothetical protein